MPRSIGTRFAFLFFSGSFRVQNAHYLYGFRNASCGLWAPQMATIKKPSTIVSRLQLRGLMSPFPQSIWSVSRPTTTTACERVRIYDYSRSKVTVSQNKRHDTRMTTVRRIRMVYTQRVLETTHELYTGARFLISMGFRIIKIHASLDSVVRVFNF